MRSSWSPRKKSVVRLVDPLLPWADALAGGMENWVGYDRSFPVDLFEAEVDLVYPGFAPACAGRGVLFHDKSAHCVDEELYRFEKGAGTCYLTINQLNTFLTALTQ